MDMDNRRLINHKDYILIGAVILLALCVYAFSMLNRADASIQAEIQMDGRVVQTLSLGEDIIFPLSKHPGIEFIVENGRIAFYKSDCPDHICVRSGFLHLPGQMAVCLPNRVVLTIVGMAENGDGADIFLD